MVPVLKTAPTAYPISIAEAKRHLRVDFADDDELIAGLIGAATEYAEAFTNRRFITQTWELHMDQFPGDEFRVPYPPLSSSATIDYTDTAGDAQQLTYAAEDYQIDAKQSPGRILPAYGDSWPSTRGIPNAVKVTYICGYGDPEDVPDGIKAALKLLVAHWYENREPVVLGTAFVTEVPKTVDTLLSFFRTFWNETE